MNADQKFAATVPAVFRRKVKFLIKEGCFNFSINDNVISCVCPSGDDYTLTRTLEDGVITLIEEMDGEEVHHSASNEIEAFEKFKNAWL